MTAREEVHRGRVEALSDGVFAIVAFARPHATPAPSPRAPSSQARSGPLSQFRLPPGRFGTDDRPRGNHSMTAAHDPVPPRALRLPRGEFAPLAQP